MTQSQHEHKRIHYIHRMDYTTRERLVGIFVLGAMTVMFMLFLLNSTTANLFQDSITLNAYLKNAEGISTETVIKASGIEVGTVKRIDIARDNRIHLTLKVYERYRELIRKDSRATIGKLSVLGRSTIDIEAGSPTQPPLADGDTIDVEEPLSINELISELAPVVKAAESSITHFSTVLQAIEPKHVESIVRNLEQASSDIRVTSEQVVAGKGSLGMAVYDEEFKQDLRLSAQALAVTLTQTQQRMQQLESVLAQLDSITADASKASPELPVLMQETRGMISQLNTTLTSVNLEVKQIPELITRMNVLMKQTDRLLEGVADSWLFSNEAAKERSKLIGVQPPHE